MDDLQAPAPSRWKGRPITRRCSSMVIVSPAITGSDTKSRPGPEEECMQAIRDVLLVKADDGLDGWSPGTYVRFALLTFSTVTMLWPFVGAVRAVLAAPGLVVCAMIVAELLLSRATLPAWRSLGRWTKTLLVVTYLLVAVPSMGTASLLLLSGARSVGEAPLLLRILWLYAISPVVLQGGLFSIRVMRN